jgi:DNA-binding GntR family transcriptional regulator
MADNRWRSQMVADLRKVMKLNRHNSLLKQGRIEDSLNEHRAILDAMLARDAEGTRRAMQAHFAQGLQAATCGPAPPRGAAANSWTGPHRRARRPGFP